MKGQKKNLIHKKNDGGYSSLNSTGVSNSTMSETDHYKKAVQKAKAAKKKSGNRMNHLLDIEKEFGKHLSQKELDKIALILAEGHLSFKEFISYE